MTARPSIPIGNILFDYADAEGMNVFGTSAKYIDALRKAELRPRDTHSLGSVRADDFDRVAAGGGRVRLCL